jgi:hypothetical protein
MKPDKLQRWDGPTQYGMFTYLPNNRKTTIEKAKEYLLTAFEVTRQDVYKKNKILLSKNSLQWIHHRKDNKSVIYPYNRFNTLGWKTVGHKIELTGGK